MTSGLPWGLALTSGVNTYLPLFMLALFARFGHVVSLSPRFQWLISDQAIFILGVLAVSEVLAQKFPVLDNLWDFVHTLLRPIAGALAAGATLSTDQAAEVVLAMVMGGTLAAAAHSTKSSLRLMSTSKSFGTTNVILSLGEDAAVIAGTLLSVYAPWVMLALVVVFVLVFALVGPPLLRMFAYNIQVAGNWFTWLAGRVFRRPSPRSLEESLLEPTPDRLEQLKGMLEPNEGLLGALNGWRRSGRGPRATWLLVTPKRLMLVERRLFRRPKVQAIRYPDLSVARFRSLGFFSKVELLTRQNESYSLSLRKTHAALGGMAVEKICELCGLPKETARAEALRDSRLASVPH